MRNTVVGSIWLLEGIRVQSGAAECPFQAIRPCKSFYITQKVLTWPKVRNLRPLDLVEAMMLFLAMGSNFLATYITHRTKLMS